MAQKAKAGELTYEFKGDVSGLTGSLKQAEASVKSLSQKVKQSFQGQAADVFKGLFAYDALKNAALKAFEVIKEGVEDALKEQRMMNETHAILEKQGLAWEKVGKQVTDFGNRMLKLGIDNETAMLQASRFSQLLGGDLKKSFDTAKLAADLAASGYGTFEENAERLQKVLAGKGLRALMEYNVVVREGAGVAEQLAAIQKRVTITAEEFAKTTEGQLQRISVAQAEVKSAFGRGIIVAFSDLIKKSGEMSGELVTSEATMKRLALVAFQLANSLVAGGLSVAVGLKSIGALADLSRFGFNKLSESLSRTEESAKLFREEATKDLESMADFQNLVSLLKDALNKASGEGFDQLNKSLEEADLKLKTVAGATKDLTEADKEAAEEAQKAAKTRKEAFEALQENLLKAKDSVNELAASIQTKLTDAFKEFKKTLGDDIKDSGKKLAAIVVGAEKEIVALKKQLADDPGEWVMPAHMVRAMSGLVNQLERTRSGSVTNRTVNAPININAKVDGNVDFRGIGREFAWELGRL